MKTLMAKDVAECLGNDMRVSNRSLFVDKYLALPDGSEDDTARTRCILELINKQGFKGEPELKSRWEAVSALSNAVVMRLKTGSRLIVNHAGGVIENAGLALDRHSGSPCIPGSTVKGIARVGATMCGESKEHKKQIALVFGWTPSREWEPDLPSPEQLPRKSFGGAIAFLPAWAVSGIRFESDIVTVHHKAYYEGKKPQALDDESPVPNVFPTVTAGTEFLFVLAMLNKERIHTMADAMGIPGFDALVSAKQWLITALTEHGIGAKTAAGYGWFEYDAEAERKREEAAEREQRAAEEKRRREVEEHSRLNAMTPEDRAAEELGNLADEPFAAKAKVIADLDPAEQKALLNLLTGAKRDKWKTWKKKKADLAAAITAVAAQHGVSLP